MKGYWLPLVSFLPDAVDYQNSHRKEVYLFHRCRRKMSNSDDAKARAQMIQKYDMYRAQRRAEMNSRDYVLSQVSTLFPDSESGQGKNSTRKSARRLHRAILNQPALCL